MRSPKLNKLVKGASVITSTLLLRRGATRLHYAASMGWTDTVLFVLSRQPLRLEQADIFGLSPLQYACFWGQAKVVDLLCKKGASVSRGQGWSPLSYATAAGHVEIIRSLIARGADPNVLEPTGHRPLHIAAARRQSNAAQALLEMGAIADAQGANGLLPLDVATENDDSSLVKMLCDHTKK
jgi:uncharacterized protein